MSSTVLLYAARTFIALRFFHQPGNALLLLRPYTSPIPPTTCYHAHQHVSHTHIQIQLFKRVKLFLLAFFSLTDKTADPQPSPGCGEFPGFVPFLFAAPNNRMRPSESVIVCLAVRVMVPVSECLCRIVRASWCFNWMKRK